MARYNLIQIDDIYLTQNGLESGKPCRTRVSGLNNLIVTRKGNAQQASDGSVYIQISPNAANHGVDITVTVDWLHKDIFDLINEKLNIVVDDSDTMALTIFGDTGDYDLTVVPNFPNPVDFPGEFSGGIIRNVTYKFKTV